MKVIYKYLVADLSTYSRDEPAYVAKILKGGEVLGFGLQGGAVVLWALVDPAQTELVSHTYYVYPTGHEFQHEEGCLYRATVSQQGFMGPLVLHVFEETSKDSARWRSTTPEEIAACPIQSLSPSHYRKDGTCLCKK